MPAIFIGVGGVGGSIVRDIRESLELHKLFAGDHPAAVSAAGQFRFVLVDTWTDSAVSGQFESSEVFDVPSGADKFNIDSHVQHWYYGGDDFFARWWPEDQFGSPLRVGDFAAGAGQLRAKGKLAYRIKLTGAGIPIVAAVKASYYSIMDALGKAKEIQPVPIYIICSLGGGSGSGMSLTLAQHLRQEIPAHCPLIGVFPLASVTEMKVPLGDTSSIWANTDAALREIDYCQQPSLSLKRGMLPYLRWPGHGNEMNGQDAPFQYCYIYTKENQKGLTLPNFADYERLIAECLVAETFSGLMDDAGLDKAIAGPHSQFLAHLSAHPMIAGRPSSYASTAVGSVRFPTDRVTEHLGRRYGAATLRLLGKTDENVARSLVHSFLATTPIRWSEGLEAQLEEPRTSLTLEQMYLVGSPRLDDKELEELDKGRTVTRVTEKKSAHDAWLTNELNPHLTHRQKEIADDFGKPGGQLEAWVVECLENHGLGTTLAAVRHLHRLIQHDYDTLLQRNDEWKQQGHELEDAWNGGIKKLQDGFGSGLTGVFAKNGRKAKTDFLKQVWTPRTTILTDMRKSTIGLSVLAAIRSSTETMLNGLTATVQLIDMVHKNLNSSAAATLGAVGFGGVLDVPVFDDEFLVDHHFSRQMADAISGSAEATAQSLMTMPGGIRDHIKRSYAAKGQIGVVGNDSFRLSLSTFVTDSGKAHFREGINNLSVWDALAFECKARGELDAQNEALIKAVSLTQKAQALAAKAGAPPRDWDALLLEHYIRETLFTCQHRIAAFWNLDTMMLANHQKPYAFTVIATDVRAYQDAQNQYNLPDFLSDAARQIGASEPYNLPGKDTIVIYAREGVSPLCFLNKGELNHLAAASGQISATKYLYTDRRFEHVVAPRISPGESADNTLRYAMASAIKFQLLTPSSVDPTRVQLQLNGAPPREFDSFLALYDTLREDEDTRRELFAAVNQGWNALPSPNRTAVIGELLGGAQTSYRLANQRIHGRDGGIDTAAALEANWWKEVVQTIQTRHDHGFHVIQF